MLMSAIEPAPPCSSWRIVRMLRRWSASGGLDGERISSLVRLGAAIGVAPQAAVALASMFQLTEACLGRPLETECCSSLAIGRDERAVLMMLSAALPAHPHQSFPPIPHGLPGALFWAVASVNKLIGEVGYLAATPVRCPFD